MAVVIIVGSYQFYFFFQRRHAREPIEFPSKLDERIPFRPGWVWVYSALYYPVLVLGVLSISSFRQFSYTVFSFLLLLIAQFACFYFFPVRIPARWRHFDLNQSISTRFLGLVHKFDSPVSAFPSAHVSVATLTALHLYANLGTIFSAYAIVVFLFPVLIAVSSLFTKQHYAVDILPGALLGCFSFILYIFLI